MNKWKKIIIKENIKIREVVKNLNKSSIGIELENKGHEFGYQKFSTKQINVLINLCLLLKKNTKPELFLGLKISPRLAKTLWQVYQNYQE